MNEYVCGLFLAQSSSLFLKMKEEPALTAAERSNDEDDVITTFVQQSSGWPWSCLNK